MPFGIEMTRVNNDLAHRHMLYDIIYKGTAMNTFSQLFEMHSYKAKQFDVRKYHPEVHNSIIRKKKQISEQLLPDDVKKTLRITCQENFHEYLVNSTLHGLRYAGDRSLTPFERWVLVLGIICINTTILIT